MKKKIFSTILVFAIALSLFLTGCGSNATDTPAVEATQTEALVTATPAAEEVVANADDGIGEVVPLTDEEISYVLSLNTKSWLDLTDAQQDDVISLTVRWWESVDGYVDPDFDLLKQDLTHQMETYFRNNVDIGVFETACDIRGIDTANYFDSQEVIANADDGIGEVVPLTDEEISYVLSLNTKSWLDLTDAQQDDVISLTVRWWESVDGYVDPDFDLLKQDLTHQMETYFRNNVDIGVFETACDIRGIDTTNYLD
jgi:hypothetical protein